MGAANLKSLMSKACFLVRFAIRMETGQMPLSLVTGFSSGQHGQRIPSVFYEQDKLVLWYLSRNLITFFIKFIMHT